MVLDKVLESFLAELSLFYSRWRVGAFFVGMLLVSNSIFLFFDMYVYTEEVSSFSSEFVSSLFSVKVYEFVILLVFSFFFSPLISAFVMRFFIKKEFRRAEGYFLNVMKELDELNVEQIHEQLSSRKSDALEGGTKISRLKGLNEFLVFAIFLGGWRFIALGENLVPLFVYIIFAVLLQFRSSQEILATHLRFIFPYRAAIDRLQKLI
ncbi:hypothetical protein [Pseudomonas aeruginosa]|uniref:hypothetical protein n=1 Tax=Pseudomonas aeruginosa TaxID=287 RepID=UPI0013C50BBE|nr:hypothetical protein [Pseudomonas aeruginosa]